MKNQTAAETLDLMQKHFADKNVWCVARHAKNNKMLTLAKILCWTFRQLLLPSSAGIKI